ncbi:MAG: maleylpyruvate isomerase [Nocardioidaceae bacterium]|nr:maleylpyruvate isomerase [Nocardioidaceae bacterium]
MGAFPNLDETVVATARYLDALTVLTDDDVRAPSLLAGWTRGHVITHLARNADALCNVLHGARSGELRPMYASQEQRDADIEAGASRSAAELRDDAVASAGRWVQAANELPASALDTPCCRILGGPTWPVSQVSQMRWTEVEVHHADLGIGYTADDWPADFVAGLMERRRRELVGTGPAFSWFVTDTGARWSSGAGPQVTGRAADLVWWLLGRGSGAHLRSTHGALPELGSWA